MIDFFFDFFSVYTFCFFAEAFNEELVVSIVKSLRSSKASADHRFCGEFSGLLLESFFSEEPDGSEGVGWAFFNGLGPSVLLPGIGHWKTPRSPLPTVGVCPVKVNGLGSSLFPPL